MKNSVDTGQSDEGSLDSIFILKRIPKPMGQVLPMGVPTLTITTGHICSVPKKSISDSSSWKSPIKTCAKKCVYMIYIYIYIRIYAKC